MDKLGAMTTFVRIVEAGSLTGAAIPLDTSLPTVVRTLAALERHLGVSLLERTTRRIRLTDDGAQYLERCRVILSAMEEAEERFSSSRRTEPAGKLVVTASALFGRRHLAPILCDFLRRYPKVSAEMLFLDRVVNLIEEGSMSGSGSRTCGIHPSRQFQVGRTRRVVCASDNTCAATVSRERRPMWARTRVSATPAWCRAANGNSVRATVP